MLPEWTCHHPALRTVFGELRVMMRSGKRIGEFDADSSTRCKRGDPWMDSTTGGSSGLPVPFNALDAVLIEPLTEWRLGFPDRVSKCFNCFREQSMVTPPLVRHGRRKRPDQA